MLASLFFAATIPLIAPIAPQLEFAPAADTALTFTLSHRSSVSLEEGTMSMFGQEIPMTDAGMEHKVSLGLQFTQAYGEQTYHPTRTLKTFRHKVTSAMTEPNREPDEIEGSLDSPLVGRSIRWQSDQEGSQPQPTYVDDREPNDADLALLQGLRFDLDAIGLLPPVGADLKQGWKTPAAALGDLLAMGGNLHSSFSDEHLQDSGGMGLMFEPAGFWPLDLELEGDVKLKLQGTRESKGKQLAILQIAAEVSAGGSSLDRHCHLNSHYCGCEDLDCGCHPDPVQADRELKLELQGNLIWNLDGNHIQGYRLKGDYEVHYTYAKSMLGGDTPEDLSVLNARCTGEAAWELAVEPTAPR